MKKLFSLITVLTFTLFIGSAFAQTGADLKNKTPEQRAQFQTEMMTTKLELNPDQTSKVQAINLKYAQKMDPIIKSDAGRFSKFKQAKALLKEKDTELKGVFTADQFKQYQDFEAEMRDKMKEKKEAKQ
ncbi:hypothetical protein DIU31_026315 [Mucilaginibacter rubeus]|uniref:DUF4890 domain-containing protein n=1 Tax=Mucilaginibacter rubeus TaxID=2027860 RepID=A0AAE6JK24_9SPHI|nr:MULTISPECIES: hypothetical protein [Mucilaginibacter]QEM06848.1 hypothetical protein DIU31_026315 [Mucilaginibacter rubeus]QEM19437.1 hypothetical protein DIU38_026610 [Mucilaginibacter gossypii]QTE44016.1 hypothetical protein J3L19_01120 [Mucilaginibacter rubeus]QTE50617.1 hypothetical protein J3L21_01105 [Mucilaginibacter rubeus]QTE55701.1 hypothetical protein J3L23_26340 [Mucilaginibacter rubeus]